MYANRQSLEILRYPLPIKKLSYDQVGALDLSMPSGKMGYLENGRTVRELAGKRIYREESEPIDLSNKRVCLDDNQLLDLSMDDGRAVKNLAGELGNTTTTNNSSQIMHQSQKRNHLYIKQKANGISLQLLEDGSSYDNNHILKILQGKSSPAIDSRSRKSSEDTDTRTKLNHGLSGANEKEANNTKEVTSKKPKKNNFGKHVCSACGQTSVSKYNLRTHMRMHTGERPYPCKRCNLSFRSASHVNRHVRRKHTARYSDNR